MIRTISTDTDGRISLGMWTGYSVWCVDEIVETSENGHMALIKAFDVYVTDQSGNNRKLWKHVSSGITIEYDLEETT